MRKVLLIIPLTMLLAIVPAEAKKRKPIVNADNISATELAAKHDSIVDEGYRLYLKEKIAWTAEDMFFAESSHQDMMQGSIISGTYPEFGVIFYNIETGLCVYEVKTNVEKGEAYGIDSIRPLTEKELEKIKLQERIYRGIYTLDVEIQEPPKGCSFNFDWLRVAENRFRVFIIMGCNTPHIIPWGNDLSYDCDSIGNVLETRKYHHSSILTPTVVEGNKIREIFHSHTNLHPLITSTDIAIFLLYGEGLDEFKILSQGVYYRYSKKTNRIEIIER